MVTGEWRSRISGHVDAIITVVIAALTLFVLIATLNDHGMVWDEGFTVEREERLREWFHRVVGDDSVSSRAWPPRPTQ